MGDAMPRPHLAVAGRHAIKFVGVQEKPLAGLPHNFLAARLGRRQSN
jgi:hypothetical protein